MCGARHCNSNCSYKVRCYLLLAALDLFAASTFSISSRDRYSSVPAAFYAPLYIFNLLQLPFLRLQQQ